MFAFKNKHQYHNIDMNFFMSGNAKIALLVHDQRPEILKNERDPNFVGVMRSGVGIPYPIITDSGNALAGDMAGSIAKGLAAKGISPFIVNALPTESHEVAVERLKAAGAAKSVILHLDTWNSDCYQRVWVNFKVVLQVYDATGKFLGQKLLEGTQDLGGSMWNPPKHAKKVVPPFFKQKMEELFNNPEIVGFITQQ